jgi:transcriptional regulator with XRE-family HTH domain
MPDPTLHDRLAAATAKHTFRAIADITHTHPETVRRYMHGQPPSVEFLAALCTALDISPEWMLTGAGPMHRDAARRAALASATPTDLLAALAAAIDTLTHRVARIEAALHLDGVPTAHHSAAGDHDAKAQAQSTPPSEAARDRAVRIADAVARRPRPDAR